MQVYDDILRPLGSRDRPQGLALAGMPNFYRLIIRARDDNILLSINDRHSPYKRLMPFQNTHILKLLLKLPNPQPKPIKLPPRRNHQSPIFNDRNIPMIRFPFADDPKNFKTFQFAATGVPTLDGEIVAARIEAVLVVVGE